MVSIYSVEICKLLENKFHNIGLHRPMRIERYDAGDKLVYDLNPVSKADFRGTARVHLVIEKFVGGGFAGQVYRVKTLKIEEGPIDGLETGSVYAMKILVPPSKGAILFRDLLYRIGFQAPFQLQVNPTAVKSGAIWQKLIRRGAKIRFGDNSFVNNIHATFIDNRLGACGELTDWIDGRTWRLEVDEHLDMLKRWKSGKEVDSKRLGSPEYRAKKQFMSDFVKLLHDMGAYELARQYEWSTWKSQPNCLKLSNTEDNPSTGLIAVDFRAGLALLPFLPMSPGDFKLIFQGIIRGSLVQFDRGNFEKLKSFVNSHKEKFKDMEGMLENLKSAERVYRNSIPDIAHNHIRLLYSGKLWSTILKSAITGWRIKNIVDQNHGKKLHNSRFLTLFFFFIGLIPFLGNFIRRIIGNTEYRRHYIGIVTSPKYLIHTLFGKMIEKAISWHRSGRTNSNIALKISNSIGLYLCHLPLSFLPVNVHKFLTNWDYFKERLYYVLVRPVRLYFISELREQWLRQMVSEGQEKHIISDNDAEIIISRIKEPFIQKYLQSLAVHVCTLPITQVISVLIAIIYVMMHPEMPRAQAWGMGIGIIALFQVIPISPGSLVRGLYVLYLVIKERNFKDYNIAIFLGFFKYIGYLAFPIQMTYRYPTLARFMAGHWATESVHIIPVFGENGALLEHSVFYLFYNWPLTIRRRMRERAQKRAHLKPRYWHVGIYALAATGVFTITDLIFINYIGRLPDLKEIALVLIFVPLICGIVVTLGCGGATMWKRIIATVIYGVITAMLYTAVSAALGYGTQTDFMEILYTCIWRIFIFSIFSTIGTILTELSLS